MYRIRCSANTNAGRPPTFAAETEREWLHRAIFCARQHPKDHAESLRGVKRKARFCFACARWYDGVEEFGSRKYFNRLARDHPVLWKTLVGVIEANTRELLA